MAVPPKSNLVPSDYQTGISYEKAVKLHKPMVINFYVDWCGYCKKFAPILDGVRKDYKGKFNFVTINCENPKYKKVVEDFMISGFPTLYIYDPTNDNRVLINNGLYSNPVKLKKELDKMEGEKILYCFTFDPLGLDKNDFADWQGVSLEPIPQKILDIYEQIYEY